MPTETHRQNLHDHDVEVREARGMPVTHRAAPAAPGRRSVMGNGLKLGRLLGIEIRLHFSVLIIFGLIVFSLASTTFPSWHPNWSPSLTWGIAFAAAVLFFISLLAHEMAHSLVAKAKGIKINAITLFLFGGVSELRSNPKTPGAEFLIAIAGPAMSVLIGLTSIALAYVTLDAATLNLLTEDPTAAFASLGPMATLLLWLGPINLFLAVFNMVPGFPLDGGHVLRSVIWAVTKDPRKATRWAANAGKGVASLIMGWGIYLFVVGAFIDGVWQLLMAWFLYSAARNAHADAVLRQHIAGLTVGDLMETSFDTVPADEDVAAFTRRLAHSPQQLWPVIDAGRLSGVVSLHQVADVPDHARSTTLVGEIMTPIESAPMLSAKAPASTALQCLAESDQGIVLVKDDNGVIGLLSQHDVMRWLTLFTH
jgi:Zn-dependent protease/predicted transcriptional regulator